MKVLIVILLAACVAAEQKREAEPSYGHTVSYGHRALGYSGYGHRLSLGNGHGYGVPVRSYGYAIHSIHKREADPEPEAEAEADPWGTTVVRPAYGAVSRIGYGGLGYSSLGYGGLGYSSLGYGGLGYNSLGYGGLGYNSLGYGGLAHTGHHLGKREADPEAEPSIGYGHTLGHAAPAYGYGGYGYGNLGYGSTLLHRPAYGIRRTYVAPRTYGVYGAHGW
ncbi:unnamed protein product [Meganyctiphanes norvegica]|uniref:Uncharacterized protein n=1 Tax=Meganyctiphanes norvegica TaxID=48144 RepID=A0AAV2Q1S5_MEGNR